MLNSYKKISLKKKTFKTNSFWKAPTLSTARFQISNKVDKHFLGGLPVVLGQQSLPSKAWWLKKKSPVLKNQKHHYFFSALVFNSIFLFKRFSKPKNTSLAHPRLKNIFLLLNRLFCTKKYYKGYALKPKKGGYVTSSLGFRCFMPKSHSDRLLTNKAPVEWVIGLKINNRRKRFSAQNKKLMINIVSSSKPQQKSIRFKKGLHARGKGSYWQNLAKIVNKRVKREKTQSL